MRGNPLWQLALVLVAFIVMALPVWRLTRPAQAMVTDTVQTVEPADKAKPVTLETTAEFVPTPTEFSVTCLGQPVLRGSGQASISATWKTLFPAEGIDLVLHAVWPEAAGGQTAARLRVRLPDGREVEKSFWTQTGGVLDAVFTVPGGDRTVP